LKGFLLFCLFSVALLNYSFVIIFTSNGRDGKQPNMFNVPRFMPHHNKRSITSYWWPRVEDGGLLGRIHAMQNPADCSSSKFFVWQSMTNNEKDTRGLTAWGHTGAQHLLHALTNGDQFAAFGSRVLITDNKLWPMAKGCLGGRPETRECYFEKLTECNLSDVDDKKLGDNKFAIMKTPQDEYNRTIRTVYTSPNDPWFRPIGKIYSWTGLPGDDHSEMAMVAAAIAYYFRPKKWLRKELNRRINASIPADLDPARTVGVPIRRSDKCKGHIIDGSAAGEQECPPLENYLSGVKSFLLFDPLIENVIVTSEDRSACQEFLGMVQKEFPNLRAILNVGDVQQGTGSGSKLEAYVEGSENADVVASALTSMHLHLRARYFVITSKSTWTSTIAVMARNYGFASDIYVIDIAPNANSYSSFARKGS